MRCMEKHSRRKLTVRLTAVEIQRLQLVIDALDGKHGLKAQALVMHSSLVPESENMATADPKGCEQ
jgi:hypothetical protein